MSLLARREHSFDDLLQKLVKIFPDESKLIYDVIINLKDLNLQSDLRFAEMLAGTRIRKGYGPNRILAELKNYKISNDMAEKVISECGVDWFELARKVMIKKYGYSDSYEFNKKVKINNFLQYRGFKSEHISACCE
jgi:regulatory protein|tara:strand:- start:5591 stop:5998 length:408 start_codon:yes stop_codon:yes gene_type:complete